MQWKFPIPPSVIAFDPREATEAYKMLDGQVFYRASADGYTCLVTADGMVIGIMGENMHPESSGPTFDDCGDA